MTNISIIAFALLLFSCSSAKDKTESGHDNATITNELAEISEPVNETLDELGASLILFLKNNDFEKFTVFLPTKEDVEKIAMQYQGPEEKKKQLLLKLEENIKKIMIYSKTGFDEVFNSALKAGVAWKDAHFSHVEYDITKKDNLERASMTIFVTYNNLDYKIGIDECVRTDRGWLVTDSPGWESLD